MIRLFLALRFNEFTRSILNGLGSSIPGARVTSVDQLHLTLRFIGEVEGTMFHDIRERLFDLSAASVTLAVKGVGHFPPRGKPRVLWAGITTESGDLMILRNRINFLLRQCGIPEEKRKFHPHITLARLNNSPTGRVAQFLADNSNLEIPPCTVDHVTLFSSVLTPKGAVHRIEQEYPLKNR